MYGICNWAWKYVEVQRRSGKICNSVSTVSYTHLEVYKRQAEDAASKYADRIFHETGHQVRRQAGKIIERKKEKVSVSLAGEEKRCIRDRFRPAITGRAESGFICVNPGQRHQLQLSGVNFIYPVISAVVLSGRP